MCNTNTDCGTCEHCQQTDDYGTAWRNPTFRSPDDGGPDAQPNHAPALTRDGFTEALLRRDGGR